MPELVRRHPAPKWVLAAVGEQVVGALEHGFEDALVDLVLVAPAAARRGEQQVVEASQWLALCSARMSCSAGSSSIVRRPAAVLERARSLYAIFASSRELIVGVSATQAALSAGAGADEAILVVSPITERSIRALGDTLAALDR